METYDVVVLGGGSGSQVATAAAEAGLTAAVCEPGPLGGACITRGCVPSKALIHRADVCETIRQADRFGVEADLVDVDYGAITDSIRRTVYEKADRQADGLGDAENVTLYDAAGRFVDDRTIALESPDVAFPGSESLATAPPSIESLDTSPRGTGSSDTAAATGERRPILIDGERPADHREIRGEQLVIAVGGRPVVPPIDGLDDVEYLTSDDALFLDERPDRVLIVGGGYIGVELAYFFGAVGATVSLVGRSDGLLPEEDPDVSEAVTTGLERHCSVYAGYEAATVTETDGEVTLTAESDDDTVELVADTLLVATGRRPNTDDLGLEETAIGTDDAGHVETDRTLATDVDGVWAMGDVVAEQPFKHVADYEAEVVSANVLTSAGRSVGSSDESTDGESTDGEPIDSESTDSESTCDDHPTRDDHPIGDGENRHDHSTTATELASVTYRGIPHAVFTSPRVASVGNTEDELRNDGVEFESATVPYATAPLGLILDEPEAFVKAIATPDGEILGCHIVGPAAPSMIHEVAVAIRRGRARVEDVVETIHVHPAINEVVVAAFDELADRPLSTTPDWRDVDD